MGRKPFFMGRIWLVLEKRIFANTIAKFILILRFWLHTDEILIGVIFK